MNEKTKKNPKGSGRPRMQGKKILVQCRIVEPQATKLRNFIKELRKEINYEY
jgi:hypothetical protein